MPFYLEIGKKFLTGLILLCIAFALGTASWGLASIEVMADPGPDLIVRDITLSPSEPALGETVSITIAVKNEGTTEAGNSHVACHIDDTILTSGLIGSIGAGVTRTAVFTWTAQAGSHIIKAIADSSGLVVEDDENNNTKTYNFTTLAADLIVESVSWTPENPSKGDDVVFSIVIKNQGNIKSSATSVNLYTNDISRGFKDVIMLNPGDSVTRTFDWMAPAGQQAIRAVVDETNTVNEGDETNNEKSLTFSTLPPDLIIQAITWTPEKPSKNDVITFTITIENQGSGNSDPCHLAYYINNEYHSAVKISSPDAGKTTTVTFDWTMISSEFEFKTVVDYYNDVLESEEKNNEKKVNVFSVAPDLTIKDITWTPQDAAVGDLLTFTVTIKNQGIGKAEASHLSYFVGNTHSGYVNVPILAADAETNVTFQWKTQLDTLALSVKVIADYDNRIYETIEYNNVQTTSISLILPDLVISAISWSPENPTVGDTVTFTVTVNNLGAGKANISHVAYYIDEVLLGTDPVYTAELSPYVKKTRTWTSQIGLHTFKAIADCNRLITESNENNNTNSVTVIPNMPDLYVSNFTWSPVNFSAGEEVNFNVSVKNRGGALAAPSRLICYIDDMTSGYQDVAQVVPGATVSKDFLWIAADGFHTVELVIDTNDTVNEFDETNNSRLVLLPPPDLVIQDLTWAPNDAGIGDTINLTATVTNEGAGKAQDSRLTICIDDITVATLDFAEIGSGQSMSRSCEWTAEAATHNIRLFADDGNMVTESDETNNEKTVVFSPRSPDLILETVNWSMEKALIDNEVTFTIVVMNQGNYKAGNSRLTYYVDDLLLETVDVAPLQPGETATHNFIVTVEAGLHTFEIFADSDEQVVESNETNNQKELPFSTMAPDLLVKSINLWPVIADIGQTVTVTVKLENQGRDTALDTSLDLRINGNSLGITNIDKIDVGEIITRDYTWTVEEGTYEFLALIDLEEMILENNEDNNVLSSIMTFNPLKKNNDPVIQISNSGNIDTGFLANNWMIIIVAAALLGGAAFFITFKSFKKE